MSDDSVVQSIEEAWGAFCRTPVLEYTGLVNGKTAEATKEAARAVALASHAAGCRWASRETGIFCGRGWSCAVRKRILALPPAQEG